MPDKAAINTCEVCASGVLAPIFAGSSTSSRTSFTGSAGAAAASSSPRFCTSRNAAI